MADNTRNKGRAASLAGAHPAPLPAPPLSQTASTDTDAPASLPPTTTPLTGIELILKRIDAMEAGMADSFSRMEKKSAATYNDLTQAIERSNKRHLADRREILIVRQELVLAKELNHRMEVQLNQLINRQNICNIRIDGIKEDVSESLKKYVVEMAHCMGVVNMTQQDVITAYRVGKPAQNNARARSRTVLITFVNERARNAFFFARSSLKNQEKFKGVFVNDDVSPATRKQRDDYRAVAALARQDGVDVRVHTDGILLAGKKYLLTEPQTLPEKYTVNKAKTYEHGGEIYFASASSFLSNFSPSPIVEGDITYMTAEHMYQAGKCRHAQANDKLKLVLAAPSPLEAKRIADAVVETPEWRQVRDALMEGVISAKFDQNPDLAHELLGTGDKPLNEATHNDHFGIGVPLMAREIKDKSYRGTNKLGQILVNKRASLRVQRDA